MTVNFQDGQRVRFRVGERGPEQMPCCGQWLDLWELLAPLSGKVFRVTEDSVRRVCCFCGSCLGLDSDPNLICLFLDAPLDIRGRKYTDINAYPQELELVE